MGKATSKNTDNKNNGKNQNKTVVNDGDVTAYIASVENETRRVDAQTILTLMCDITGYEPKLWGGSIIGFGEYHYKYDSGREGDFLRTGFSPRKTALTIYIMPGYQDYSEILSRLGKHKIGKSCLYINKLADVDMAVLEELIRAGLAYMDEKYPV
ncbi:DUF1801 domain-containing protein [Kordiimonas sp. SCSIO 12610]|uniref:DUF1801 domain-containing protein n=1 Tax=Kordiimonas sp. SCSIO 12610 TaxID=2829597 RepID=UPI00210D490E|nr:DUF1801 domain-containing protein [Kordiimonas sp. SCSIO 12610]UTW56303.1 DUF1801 domain-containing protein [Kordiimonas sp. SCSIO 12610]